MANRHANPSELSALIDDGMEWLKSNKCTFQGEDAALRKSIAECTGCKVHRLVGAGADAQGVAMGARILIQRSVAWSVVLACIALHACEQLCIAIFHNYI